MPNSSEPIKVDLQPRGCIEGALGGSAPGLCLTGQIRGPADCSSKVLEVLYRRWRSRALLPSLPTGPHHFRFRLGIQSPS